MLSPNGREIYELRLRLPVEKKGRERTVENGGREYSILDQCCRAGFDCSLQHLMNSIPVWTHLQKEPFVCPQCGSTERIPRDLCLRCMLSLGLDGSGDISDSQTLDGLLRDIDP